MTATMVKRLCNGTSKNTGGPCPNPPMNGAEVCYHHGGASPQVRKKAIVRAEVDAWGVNDDLLDPGTVLLRLVSQSARRAEFYASLLAAAYQAADDADRAKQPEEEEDLLGIGEPEPARVHLPGGVRALIGKKFTVTPDGDRVEVSEAIRGLVTLETQERKLCADFASKAIAAGLAERQVRIAEQQGTAIIAAITIALDRAGLIGPARLEAQNAAADYLDSLDVA